jgi:hypothetical protein
MHPNAAANEVYVLPSTCADLGTSQTRTLHKQDRRSLTPDRGRPQRNQLVPDSADRRPASAWEAA